MADLGSTRRRMKDGVWVSLAPDEESERNRDYDKTPVSFAVTVCAMNLNTARSPLPPRCAQPMLGQRAPAGERS